MTISEMDNNQIVKVIVGASRHYRPLKSGMLEYQHSKPSAPIWRIMVLSPDQRRISFRLFPSKPSAEEISQSVVRILSSSGFQARGVLIPLSTENLAPGVRQTVRALGLRIYAPLHGSAAGARYGSEEKHFLSLLGSCLRQVRESMASVDEIVASCDNPDGIISFDLEHDYSKPQSVFVVARHMASRIAIQRGHDPEVGASLRREETRWAPLNTSKKVPPPEDVLDTLIRKMAPGSPLWGCALLLRNVRDASPADRNHHILQLGQAAVKNQYSGFRSRSNFLSDLSFLLRGQSLETILREGVKEALRQPVPLGAGLFLYSAAACIRVEYGTDCEGFALRRIPAHHHIDNLFRCCRRTDGQVLSWPYLADSRDKTPVFLTQHGPLDRGYSMTQINPRNCLTRACRPQVGESLLTVAGVLSRPPAHNMHIGDTCISVKIESLINERLARTGKSVKCSIEPFRAYGDVMRAELSGT